MKTVDRRYSILLPVLFMVCLALATMLVLGGQVTQQQLRHHRGAGRRDEFACAAHFARAAARAADASLAPQFLAPKRRRAHRDPAALQKGRINSGHKRDGIRGSADRRQTGA